MDKPRANFVRRSTPVLLGLLLSAGAYAETFSFYGVEMNLAAIQTQLANGSLWSTIGASNPTLADCDDAFEKIKPQNKTKFPAKSRHRAAVRAQECLAEVRAAAISGSASQKGTPEFVSAQTNAAQLAFQSEEKKLDDTEQSAGADQSFMGMSFGVGVGASYAEDKRISEAELAADGTIRATKSERQEPRVILESHYYGLCKLPSCNAGEFGIGPFFGIVAKDDKLISAFALGAMFGWKTDKEHESRGFSIGIGVLLDSDIKSLADGFDEGKPPPIGETAVKFETKSRWGALLFLTQTF